MSIALPRVFSAVSTGFHQELRATILLALPLVFTQLSQIAIMTTDVLLMGWLGSAPLAAGALGFNLYLILWVFGLGMGLAAAPMMAQAIGRKLHALRDVRRTLRQALWVTLLIGIAGGFVIWHAGAVLILFRQDPANAALAQEYCQALAFGFVPSLWFVVLRQFLAAYERPNASLVVQLITFVFNAALAYVLMFGKAGFPALGLFGAGIATAIANWFSFVAMLGFILADRRFRRFRILGRFWRPDWRRFAEIFRLGLPISATTLFEVIAFSGAVYLMGLIGTPELAAHQIAIQCAATTFMVALGVGQAATVRVGLHAGAGDRDGVRRAGLAAFMLGIGFMAVMALPMLVFRDGLAGLFIDGARPEDARTAQLAAAFLAVAAFFQLFDGAQAVGMGVLRGLKDTRVPMVFAGFGYWIVGLPVGAVLAWPLNMGGEGIWWGLALGLAVVAGLVVHRFSRREKLGLIR